jgi:hypothetical protein
VFVVVENSPHLMKAQQQQQRLVLTPFFESV